MSSRVLLLLLCLAVLPFASSAATGPGLQHLGTFGAGSSSTEGFAIAKDDSGFSYITGQTGEYGLPATPGAVGLAQANIRIQDLPSGEYSLTRTIAGQASNTVNVTVTRP